MCSVLEAGVVGREHYSLPTLSLSFPSSASRVWSLQASMLGICRPGVWTDGTCHVTGARCDMWRVTSDVWQCRAWQSVTLIVDNTRLRKENINKLFSHIHPEPKRAYDPGSKLSNYLKITIQVYNFVSISVRVPGLKTNFLSFIAS